MSNFFEFKAEDTRCEVHSMEEYRGKVVLVVNTATQCGFTGTSEQIFSPPQLPLRMILQG